MKRYLLATIAIIAVAVFSAFTNAPKKQAHTSLEDPYYWYHVDVTQTETDGSTINPDGREYKDVYVTGECLDDDETPICLVGFFNPVADGTPIPGSSLQIIRKTENP